jgi:hypothetical protein
MGGGGIVKISILSVCLLLVVSCGNQSMQTTATTTTTTTTTTTLSQLLPPAQAAGYALAFEDDFSNFDLSADGTGSHTWYPGIWWETKPSPFAANVYSQVLDLGWSTGQTPADTTISSCAPQGATCHSYRYGYFEARMKWDVTTGAWPAFWMIPTQGFSGASETGELDLFEGQGDPTNAQTYFGTIHDWQTLNGRAVDVANNGGHNFYKAAGIDFSTWHTYGVLWVPGQVTWYLDNQPILSAATYAIFDSQNYYLMLGSQEGANWTSGSMTGVTASSINLYVQWVHVWQAPTP